ncbi:hypothetical protein EDB86DRAFT_3089694 [Lactarius hatsudake]|nr:hypothetical protein EDB86DRAFT_3089694 [Lactarius hatsudake]
MVLFACIEQQITLPPELYGQLKGPRTEDAWLVQARMRFRSPETFYLTVSIIDRFISAHVMSPAYLQSTGIRRTYASASSRGETLYLAANIIDRFLSTGVMFLANDLSAIYMRFCLFPGTPYLGMNIIYHFLSAHVESPANVQSVVNFLVEILLADMLFCPPPWDTLAMNIVDRFPSAHVVSNANLRSVGISKAIGRTTIAAMTTAVDEGDCDNDGGGDEDDDDGGGGGGGNGNGNDSDERR